MTHKYFCVTERGDSDFDPGTSDEEEDGQAKADRYAAAAEKFAELFPEKKTELQKVVTQKLKVKDAPKGVERLEYLGFLRDRCRAKFQADLLVSEQKSKAKKRVWRDFKRSKFGPLRSPLSLSLSPLEK